MRLLLGLAVALALVAGAPAVADDPPKSPAEQLKQLQKDVADAQKKALDLRRKVQGVEDTDEKKKLTEESQKANAEFLKLQQQAQGKAAAIAKANAKDEAGLDAAIWALPGLRAKPAEMKEILGLVVEHHAANKKITGLIGPLTMQANTDPKVIEILEVIAEKSPHKSVQAAAVFAVADSYKNRTEPRGRPAPADADELAKKAEAGFERILKDFADESQGGRGKYGTAAKTALFELRNLRVGKTVPEIEGEDTDGSTFKLSDYRGKVVMLDFWGHW